jgi:dihydroxy-acid dehydratase
MPEVGNMSIPKKLLDQGVTDMVRLSDARMSGTAYGAAVLHIAPEAAVGGNFALVRDGDWIELDVDNRRLHLEVSDEELAKRREAWVAPDNHPQRGYTRLFLNHIMQANTGMDFDILLGASGDAVVYKTDGMANVKKS